MRNLRPRERCRGRRAGRRAHLAHPRQEEHQRRNRRRRHDPPAAGDQHGGTGNQSCQDHNVPPNVHPGSIKWVEAMATSNSPDQHGIAFLVALSLWAVPACAGAPDTNLAAYYLGLYQTTRTQHLAQPTHSQSAWEFARGCYDLAEFATNHTQRAALAREGIAASRSVIQREPTVAPAHYYLALNLGQLARDRSLSSLRLVGDMEKALLTARTLDPRFDFAGADRALALLYFEAPGWPISVGSRKKARQHFEQTLELSPDYPGNRLNWLAALVEWGEDSAWAAERAKTAAVLEAARTTLTGQVWQASWMEWEDRWRAVTNRIEARSRRKPRPGARPRQQTRPPAGPRSTLRAVLAGWACAALVLAPVTGCRSGSAASTAARPPAASGTSTPAGDDPASAANRRAPPTRPPKPARSPQVQYPSIRPVDALVGHVVRVNAPLQFAVLDFSFAACPPPGRRLGAYRGGIKVGELCVSEVQRGSVVAADILSGEVLRGDEVREEATGR